MSLPESIQRAWRATDYRVRLPEGGYASIRHGAALPPRLLALLDADAAPWGYITAWNPAGVRLPTASNRLRQRRLRDVLRAERVRFYPGAGVGTDGWREASLFVPGVDFACLDALALQFGQLGILRGRGNGPAELRELI